MKKPHSLTVRRYAERLIELNKYLSSFPGDNLYDKIGVTKLSEKILISMPDIWYKQAYAQGFDCEYISFKKAVYVKQMYITESIYEGVVEPSSTKIPGQMPTVLITSGIR